MKFKSISVVMAFLLLSSFAIGQALSGGYYMDSDTPGYTLQLGEVEREFNYEVVFDKPFDVAPEVFLTMSLIDESDESNMRYSVSAKNITRDGFTVQAKVWGGAKISAIGGNWIALVQKKETPPPPPTTTLTFDNVYFDYNKSVLKQDAKVALDKIADLLVKNPNVKVMISGHTDDRGTDVYNKKLGERRADAAKDYLVKKGIDATRLMTKSEGETLPAVANTTEQDRAKNRRVEFKEVK